MRIFSGIRSSGDKTLGNYSGGFRQYVATQEQGDAFFCVVDLHSITTPFEPEVLHEATLSVAGWLFATGLDPDRSTVFVQSHVQAHAEAAWLLGRCRELRRAPADDAVQGALRGAGLRLLRALQLSRAHGRRHPALRGRHRPDRRRPAPASRARAEHRRALQRTLRGDVQGSRRRVPRGGCADQEPPGAGAADVDDARRACGRRPDDRPAGRGAEEVQDRGHRLGHRGAPRSRGESPASRT